MSSTTTTSTAREVTAAASYDCPHCHKPFEPVVDSHQPPRLQGAKCPHCKLMVPARTLERIAPDA